jgi:radical SAM superfamily enzyme YgiQ (UPF0313 family)
MKVGLYMCGGERPVSQFSLGLGYLASNCAVEDVIIEMASRSSLPGYDMIGLSANAWGMKEAYDIMKTSNVPVILGGQATLWEGCRDLGFAHVVIGEGEEALNKILRKEVSATVIEEKPMRDIDNLAFPMRGNCGKTVPVLTSRGCPYQCNFCSSKTYWHGVRFHSAEYFMKEVEYIASQYPAATELYILDDLFIAKPSRFSEIHGLWMKGGWSKRFTLESFVRSNMFTEDIGKAMKEMGFRNIRFGAESGSNRMLKLLNKQTTVEDHQRTIDIACKLKLPVSASFMHGLPGEAEEDRQATKDFIARNRGRLQVRGDYEFKAFPGTLYYSGEDLLKTDMRVR